MPASLFGKFPLTFLLHTPYITWQTLVCFGVLVTIPTLTQWEKCWDPWSWRSTAAFELTPTYLLTRVLSKSQAWPEFRPAFWLFAQFKKSEYISTGVLTHRKSNRAIHSLRTYQIHIIISQESTSRKENLVAGNLFFPFLSATLYGYKQGIHYLEQLKVSLPRLDHWTMSCITLLLTTAAHSDLISKQLHSITRSEPHTPPFLLPDVPPLPQMPSQHSKLGSR